jgi:hypothetical protein
LKGEKEKKGKGRMTLKERGEHFGLELFTRKRKGRRRQRQRIERAKT